MTFKLTFIYMDKEDLDLLVREECIERFMQCLGKAEVYFDVDTGKGVWIPIEKIRYFTVERQEEVEKKPIKKRAVPKKSIVANTELVEIVEAIKSVEEEKKDEQD